MRDASGPGTSAHTPLPTKWSPTRSRASLRCSAAAADEPTVVEPVRTIAHADCGSPGARASRRAQPRALSLRRMVEKGDQSFVEAAAAVFGDLPGLLASMDDDLVDDLIHALDEEEESFRARVPDLPFPWYGGMLLVELEWTGSGTNQWELRKDFYRLLGWFAEEALFIQERNEGDAVVYELVTGSFTGAHRHVHHVRFRLSGPRVDLALSPGFMPLRKHRQ